MRCRYPLPLLFVMLAALPAHPQSTWQSLAGGLSSQVSSFSFSPDSSHLLVGGHFGRTNADSLWLPGIAAWDGQHWSAAFTGGGAGDTICYAQCNSVMSVNWLRDTLFVGHYRTQWQYDPAKKGATFFADSAWHTAGEPDQPVINFLLNGRLFRGGLARVLYGDTLLGPNEWIDGRYRELPNNPVYGSGRIYAATHWQGQYYFGGVFLALGTRKVVAFDGVDQWSGLGGGVGGVHVNTLCGYGDSLYAGGYFVPGNDPDVFSRHIQLWDGAAWHPFFPEVTYVGQVLDIQTYQGELYISGIYHFTDDTTLYGLLRYDGHSLCAIGGPMAGDNGKMAFFQDHLYLATWAGTPGLYLEYLGRLPLHGLVPDRCIAVGPNAVPEGPTPAAFSVAPNPTTGLLTLALPGVEAPAEVLLTDALGRTAMRLAVARAHGAVVQVEQLPAGLYLVQVVAGNQRHSARFIKH